MLTKENIDPVAVSTLWGTDHLLRGQDLHLRPPGYEPDELLLLHPAVVMTLYTKIARYKILSNTSKS